METSNGSSNGSSDRSHHRILFIDAYDSFSNNIVALLETTLDVNVDIIRIDLTSPHVDGKVDQIGSIAKICASYDAIVCGPGPGTPLNPKDVGLFSFVWALEPTIPVLGICLGFQSLVADHGGKIRRLKRGLHGMVREIEHQDFTQDIFSGVPPFTATLYHSLCADIGQDEITPEAWKTMDKLTATSSCRNLIPLAWTTERREDGTEERILMGVRHVTKPFWGLQYHPESVCTDPTAHAVLKNWFEAALRYNRINLKRRRNSCVLAQDTLSREPCVHPHNQLSALKNSIMKPEISKANRWWSTELKPDDPVNILRTHLQDYEHNYERLDLPASVGVPQLVEILRLEDDESIILDSSSSKNGDPLAQYSIMALDVEKALRIEHHVTDDFVTVRIPAHDYVPEFSAKISLEGPDRKMSVWEFVSYFWSTRRRKEADFDGEVAHIPFHGGFMGFVTYEMGLHGLDPNLVSKERDHHRPDICLVWVSKSLVIDHRERAVFIQNLTSDKEEGLPWVYTTASVLTEDPLWQSIDDEACRASARSTARSGASSITEEASEVRIREPSPRGYESKVRICQEEIAAGQSYELCLTDQTRMTRPRRERAKSQYGSPWRMYQTLRSRQPAPFGSYIRLGGATLLSCSPERFLSHDAQGLCSMRPMKGTVRKSEAVSTLAQAEEILHVPKEEAENLMIVDLVRHDLHGICGAGNVTVPDLMKVEEYATVFQMITVVNGQLPHHESLPYTGFDALAVSLPPGSMTGAPKKRSCEILKRIEKSQERSLYSGVVGFMNITGNGDWSVTIRSIFNWDDELVEVEGQEDPQEVWRIGAGGAVTILSTPEGEREEMFTKLSGPLGVFRDTA